MKTLIQIEVTHYKPIPHLANFIAGRAYTIDGVSDAAVLNEIPQDAPIVFTADELALGHGELHRS